MKNQFFQAFLLMSFFTVLSLLGCGKDDTSNTTGCNNFPTSGSTITLNGKSSEISAKQLVTQAGVAVMSLSAISDECNKLTSVVLNFELANSGTSLNGTFPIKSFDDAEEGDASGNLVIQTILPVSQNATELASGTAKITDKGSKKYTVDITAKAIDGTNVTLKGDIQF